MSNWTNAAMAVLVAYLSASPSSSNSSLIVSPRIERFLAVLSLLTIVRKRKIDFYFFL